METEGRLSDALEILWKKFQPQIEERVAVLEAANRALAEGALTAEAREAAHAAAHKLAGILGTFGLAEGTALAREVEGMYGGDAALDEAAKRLSLIVAELGRLLSTRGS
ncbi:MAG TPA: Hpt domain-containing protein [Terracidiphilus sp.]|jgi:HPt (histidine-containing phosphotransfer) domain-containing protein|nr:Hpt domain-containing protein [Terracidiphilus sp.]